MIADGNSLAAISKARMEARERALAAGESWSEAVSILTKYQTSWSTSGEHRPVHG